MQQPKILTYRSKQFTQILIIHPLCLGRGKAPPIQAMQQHTFSEPKPSTNGFTITFTVLISSKANTMKCLRSLLVNHTGQMKNYFLSLIHATHSCCLGKCGLHHQKWCPAWLPAISGRLFQGSCSWDSPQHPAILEALDRILQQLIRLSISAKKQRPSSPTPSLCQAIPKGCLTPSASAEIRIKDSVDNALQAIGQMCVSMGTKDPTWTKLESLTSDWHASSKHINKKICHMTMLPSFRDHPLREASSCF